MTEKLQKLIEKLIKLPGIGPRHAMRLILALLEWPDEDVRELGETVAVLKEGHVLCERCFNFSDNGLCSICANGKRNQHRIAVVERVTDLATMEKAGIFDGVYHVLGGAINPAGGYLPEKLKVHELIIRVNELKGSANPAKIEVILATNPTTYGETTALYIEQELKPLGVLITRLARGLASGTTIEYADESTLANALKNRK